MDIQFILEFNSSVENIKKNEYFLKSVAFDSTRENNFKLIAIRALVKEYGVEQYIDDIRKLEQDVDDLTFKMALKGITDTATLVDNPQSLAEQRVAFKNLWSLNKNPQKCTAIITNILESELNFHNKDERDIITECLSTLLYNCYTENQQSILTDILDPLHKLLLREDLPLRRDFIMRLFGIRNQNFQNINIITFTRNVDQLITTTDLAIPNCWVVLQESFDVSKRNIQLAIIDYLITWITDPPFNEEINIRARYRYQFYAADKILQLSDDRYQVIIINFLLNCANSDQLSTFIRGDALDILIRNPIPDEYQNRITTTQQILEAIPEYTLRNMRLQNIEQGYNALPQQAFTTAIAGTTFTSSQTVHATEVNKGIKQSIEVLLQDPEVRGNTIYKVIKDIQTMISELETKDYNSSTTDHRNSALRALKRVLEDPAVFTDKKVTLSTIMVLVWNRISQHTDEHELHNRLVEELSEAQGTCASGHLTRIISVLAGFCPDITQVDSFESQLVNNIQAKLYTIIKKAPDDVQGDLLIAMADKFCPEYLTYINYLVDHKNIVFDELCGEFVPEYLLLNDFEHVFNKIWPC